MITLEKTGLTLVIKCVAKGMVFIRTPLAMFMSMTHLAANMFDNTAWSWSGNWAVLCKKAKVSITKMGSETITGQRTLNLWSEVILLDRGPRMFLKFLGSSYPRKISALPWRIGNLNRNFKSCDSNLKSGGNCYGLWNL